MRLRKSSFVHQVPVGPNSILLIHAISQSKLKVDGELGRLTSHFAEWREFPDAFAELRKLLPYDDQVVAGTVSALHKRDLLTEKSAEEELAAVAVSDRFADHGLVGAAVVQDDEITGLVMSGRVLGMGVEHEFVRSIASGAWVPAPSPAGSFRPRATSIATMGSTWTGMACGNGKAPARPRRPH